MQWKAFFHISESFSELVTIFYGIIFKAYNRLFADLLFSTEIWIN